MTLVSNPACIKGDIYAKCQRTSLFDPTLWQRFGTHSENAQGDSSTTPNIDALSRRLLDHTYRGHQSHGEACLCTLDEVHAVVQLTHAVLNTPKDGNEEVVSVLFRARGADRVLGARNRRAKRDLKNQRHTTRITSLFHTFVCEGLNHQPRLSRWQSLRNHLCLSILLLILISIICNTTMASISTPSCKTFVATSNQNLVCRLSQNGQTCATTQAMLEATKDFHKYFRLAPDKIRKQGGSFCGDEETSQEQQQEVLLVRGTHGALPARQGLLGTVVEAYNSHCDLELRPDDVWVTILTQFSAYVNGRAQELRGKFVVHQEGRKHLVVKGIGNIDSMDVGYLTRLMLDEISNHIKNPSLKDWFLPGFSTTTPHDQVCAAAATMCTFQQYFSYEFMLMCGIPRVTLLGTVEDWRLLRRKVDRLLDFDDNNRTLQAWVPMLQDICDNFIESAQNGSTNNLRFWDTVCSHYGGGSGPTYLSGWVTVFTFFDTDGHCQVELPRQVSKDAAPSVRAKRHRNDKYEKARRHWDDLISKWPKIDSSQVNRNVVSCPVKINDNGVEYESRLFVGQMSYDVERAKLPYPPCLDDVHQDGTATLHTLKPRNDWALVIAKRS